VCSVEGRKSVLLLGQVTLGLAVTEAIKWCVNTPVCVCDLLMAEEVFCCLGK